VTELPRRLQLPRYLQLLWDREEGGRRGPRPTHTIEGIGDAAVAIADREGLAAVSMKAVAEALGLSSMSLYRYLDSKDDLYAVMVDRAYGTADPQLTSRGSWRTRLEAWARATAAGRLAHPWIVEVPMSRPPLTPNVLSWTDCGLGAFDGVPLSAQQKLSSLLVVDGFVHNHVRQAMQMGLIGATPEQTEEYGASMAGLVEPSRLPFLHQAMSALRDDDDFYETELAFGLALLLDGISALIERQ
jgi:AcrR family transcriptional regulator